MMTTKDIGARGEGFAITFLKKNGYQILEKNYTNRLGEIDIIAKDPSGVVTFIEVKTRQTLDFGHPQYSVTGFKRRQISKVALSYLKRLSLLDSEARFDVVAIVLGDNKKPIKIELIKNAFELSSGYAY